MTTWLHYSDKPIAAFDRTRSYAGRLRADKPSGFWITPDGDDNWRTWRESAGWGIPATDYVYRVDFTPTARLLTVHDVWSLHHDFPRGRIDDVMPAYSHYDDYPSWAAIAEHYDGILIPRYHWPARMNVDWYYSWDCASGCIWNLYAIASLALISTLARPIVEEVA